MKDRSRGFQAWLTTVAFTVTLLSGCFGQGGEPAAADPSGPVESSGAPSSGAPTPAPTDPTEPVPQPPVVAFTYATNTTDGNATAGIDIVFDASESSDPMGGTLSFEWDFGDGATAVGPVANHTYAAPRSVNVTVTALSDASGLSGNDTQVLTILPAPVLGPKPIKVTDASGDGTTTYHDITTVEMFREGDNEVVKFSVASMQPGNNYETLVLYDIFIGAVNLEVYSYPGTLGAYRLYDNTVGDIVPGSSVTASGTVVTIKWPTDYLKTLKMPWSVYFQTYTGEGFLAGLRADDRAPNSGTLSYG